MPIKLTLLKHVKQRPTKTVAQCPACAETGGDAKGVHLVVYPDGKFSCAANPGDKAHRRRIAELVGDPVRQVQAWTLRLNGKIVMSGGQPASGTPITSLARSNVGTGLGLVHSSPGPGPDQHSHGHGVLQPSPGPRLDQTSLSVPDAKQSCDTPSELSADQLSDNTDTYLSTYTPKRNIHKEPHLYLKTFGPPSVLSEDIITTATTSFAGRVVATVVSGGLVPGRFRDVLATWDPTRNHPGLRGYQPRRLRGWTRRGTPIYWQ